MAEEIRQAARDTQKKGGAAPPVKAFGEALAALIENKKVEEEPRLTGKPGRPATQYRIDISVPAPEGAGR